MQVVNHQKAERLSNVMVTLLSKGLAICMLAIGKQNQYFQSTMMYVEPRVATRNASVEN